MIADYTWSYIMVSVILNFLESLITIYYISILNNSPQKFKNYIVPSIIISIINISLPPLLNSKYNFIIGLISILVIYYIFFKFKLTNILLGIISYTLITGLCELITSIIFEKILKVPFELVLTNYLCKFYAHFLILYQYFIIVLILKRFKLFLILKQELSKYKFFKISLNTFITFIVIAPNIFYLILNKFEVSSYIILLNIFTTIILVALNIFNTLTTQKLVTTEQELETVNLYNKTLQENFDTVRTFKHDFANIMQSFGGYISLGDPKELYKYYSLLMDQFQHLNNLSILNPAIINDPAIFGILTHKYYQATEKNLKVSIEIFADLSNIKFNKLDLVRMIGIFFDNAIEDASLTESKVLNLIIKKEFNENTIIIEIQNSLSNPKVDLDKIYQKSYSTKSQKTNSGIGLWEVKKLIDKNKNCELKTCINNNLFTQRLIISNT